MKKIENIIFHILLTLVVSYLLFPLIYGVSYNPTKWKEHIIKSWNWFAGAATVTAALIQLFKKQEISEE